MRTWRGLVVYYVVLVVFGFVAIHSEWNTKYEVNQMNEFAQSGMMYYQDALQNLALSMIHHQSAIQDAREAQMLQHDAMVWLNQSLADQARATELYNTSKQLTKLIKQDEIEAYKDRTQAQHEEETYQDHLGKLKYHQDKLHAINKRMDEREVATSPSFIICHRSGFRTFCDLLGGITTLRDMAKLQAMAIQSEYNQAVTAKTVEDQLLEKATSLEMEAANYSQIEHQVWRQAEELHMRAQRETVAAFLDAVFENVKEQQAKVEEVMASKEAQKFQKDAEESHSYFKKSLAHACRAFLQAVLGNVFAALVFGLTILIAIPNIHDTCQICVTSLSSISLRRPSTFRDTSYCIIHVYIFLYMVSMYHQPWIDVEEYDIRQRGEIILTFAALASLVQTVLLHSLPCIVLVVGMIQVTEQATLTYMDVCELLCNDLKRWMYLVILFGGELVIAWVLLGPTTLSMLICGLPSWISALLLVIVAGVHAYCLELCPLEDSSGNCNGATEDDETTTSDESIESSFIQVSVLTDEASSETDSLLNKYWSSAGGSQASAANGNPGSVVSSLPSSPPRHHNGAGNSNNRILRLLPCRYQMHFLAELVRLVLLVDLFFMACMVAVFVTCLPVSWSLRHLYLRQYWTTTIASGFWLILILLVAVTYVYQRRKYAYLQDITMSRDNPTNDKISSYLEDESILL